MTIIQALIERFERAVAANGYRTRDEISEREYETARSALLSYLATTEPGKPESGVLAVAVKVKPLLWEDELDISRAQTNLVACYSVWDVGDHWECSLLDGKFKDVDAAKAAAEADYEQRVMSALQPVQGDNGGVEVTDEMVRDALLAFQSGDMDWGNQDEELMRLALVAAFNKMKGSRNGR
jgi:hypothetical protein